jgi:hypothetical protein
MPPRDVANRPANSNIGLPVNWIAADVVRLKDGILIECSDAIQDEAAEQQSRAEIRCSATHSEVNTSGTS